MQNTESRKKLAAHHRESRVALHPMRSKATHYSLIITFLLSCLILPQAKSRAELPPDYAAYWRFEEEAGGVTPDETGINSGTLQGDAAIMNDQERGNILSLDGDGDYVDCGNNNSLAPALAVTIAAWVKPEEVIEVNRYIISKRQSYLLDASRNSSGGGLPHFYIYPSAGSFYPIASETRLTANAWNHIAAVFDGDNMTIYVNGTVTAAEEFALGHVNISSYDFYIGADQYRNASSCFHGGVDDVLIYPRGLSPSEVKEVYKATGGIYEGPVLGDVTGDGDISAYDASLTAQHAFGLITLSPEELLRADVTGNDDVSIYDASLIAQYAIGLIDGF